MLLTTRFFAGFVLIASVVVLGTVLVSQYVGGLQPCELCLLQRWPWTAAVVIALVALWAGDRGVLFWVALVLAAVFIVGVGLAFYHVGVEQHWYPGPEACTASGNRAATVEQLREQLLHQQRVQCDQPAWSLFGVTMAGWNLVASAMMAVICIAAAALARVRPGRAVATDRGAA